MSFLLDTNIPSEMSRSKPDLRVSEWFYSQEENELYLSAVTVGELRRGISGLSDRQRSAKLETWFEGDLLPAFAGRILPITQAVADRWGRLSGRRKLSGRPLSMADGLIAATSLEHGLTLVTTNTSDFEQLGLTILNPWMPTAD